MLLDVVSCACPHPHKPLEQIVAVLRAWAGFGVVLDAERAGVGQFEPAVAAVEQRHMRFARVGGEAFAFDREAVVHAGDLDAAVAQPLDWVVRAAVALVHLGRARTDREPEQLMAEADTEQRLAGIEPFADHRHGVLARRGGVAGAVRQEQSLRIMRHDVVETRGRGDHGDVRARIDEIAEEVAFEAVVDGDDAFSLRLPERRRGPLPSEVEALTAGLTSRLRSKGLLVFARRRR